MRTQGKQAAAMIAAEEQGCSIIEITHGMNGYPERLGDYAAIGFESFRDAEQFAAENGGTVSEFHKKDGWHLWEHIGQVWSGYTPQDFLKVAGDDYNVATNDPDEVAERLFAMGEQFSGDMDKMRGQFNNLAALWEKVDAAPEDHTVVSYCGQYFDTMPPGFMNFRHDTHHYQIGVFLPLEMND